MKKQSKRDFIKTITKASAGSVTGITLSQILKGAAATGLAIEAARSLTGCATLGFEPEENVIYPPLPGKKIQPPEFGCFFGMHYDRPGDHMNWADQYMESKIGKTPMIVIPAYEYLKVQTKHPYRGISRGQRTVEDYSSNEGTIPFINKMIDYYFVGVDFKDIADDKVFIRDMTAFAKSAVEYGRPFLFTTMHEMNLPIWKWGHNSKAFKKTWQRMHNIFDQEGANEYATWVFEPYVTSTWSQADSPWRYYPGDEFVDWQGISGYSRNNDGRSGNMSLGGIIHGLYSSYRSKTPDKPVIVAEFGKTKDYSQPRWLEGAFKYFKNHPGIKGAIYWDNVLENAGTRRDDHTLSEKSFQTLDKLLGDTYFICGKKGSKLY